MKHLKPVNITVVHHKDQRYETCGDYYEKNGNTVFRISALSSWKYEFLIALHEFIEAHLCSAKGISEEAITAFDLKFEKEREQGRWKNDEEPGDDPRAPYQQEHQLATTIERLVALSLGVKWSDYNREVNELSQ